MITNVFISYLNREIFSMNNFTLILEVVSTDCLN